MRKLGQHFLTNKRVLQKIADSLGIKDGDAVIEIGPGHGELTSLLVNFQTNKFIGSEVDKLKIVAIEKDRALARRLKEKFKNNSSVEIIEGDALKILPRITKPHTPYPKPCKLVGNIPYYITGHLFRIIGSLVANNRPPITACIFLIQKEVAERIAAEPPKMNLLAASIQVWADVKIIGNVPAKDFNPAPKVESAVIKIETKLSKLKSLKAEELRNYYKMVRVLFKQPRKTILNNLAAGLSLEKPELTEKLSKIGVNAADRPQNLAIEQIANISKALN